MILCYLILAFAYVVHVCFDNMVDRERSPTVRTDRQTLRIFIHKGVTLQLDGCKLSVLLSFHVSCTPILRLVNLESWEAIEDYTTFGG